MKIKFITALSILTILTYSSSSIYINNSQVHEYKNYIRNKDINSDGKIKNIILFIGDGMGPNHQ